MSHAGRAFELRTLCWTARGCPAPWGALLLVHTCHACFYEATTHLLAARALAPDLSPQARALLQPAVVAELVLQRLQAHGYNVFAPELREPLGLRLRTALAWNAAFRSF